MTYFENVRNVLSIKGVTATAKIIWILLKDRQGENGHSWPSLGTICKDCGLTRPSVVRGIKELQDNGLLAVKKPKNPSIGHTNLYTTTSKESKPVKELNQLRSLTETGKESKPELVKDLNPNNKGTTKGTTQKNKYGDFVLLTDEEFWKLVTTLGLEKTQEMIEALNNGLGAKGYKYKSHYHAILNWVRLEEKRKQTEKPKQKPAMMSHGFADQKSERTDYEFNV